MKPSEVMPWNSGGGGTILRLAGEEETHDLDEADAEPERDQKLVFVRTADRSGE